MRRCGVLCNALCSWEEDEDPSPQHGRNGVQCRQNRRDQGAKSLARWLVCSSACLLVNTSAEGSTLLDACWKEDEDPSPQHGTNRVRCLQSRRDQGAKSSACQLVCSLARWLICSCARWLICSSTHQPNKAPSLMHAMEYNADEANKTGEPNHWLVGLSACWLMFLSICWLVVLASLLPCWIVGSQRGMFGLLNSSTNRGNPCNLFFTCSFS